MMNGDSELPRRPPAPPSRGDDAAPGALRETLYAELRVIAGRFLDNERRAHTLQPTALVHEAWLRLGGTPDVPDPQFLAMAANTMRRILVDHARARRAAKRGGGDVPVRIDSPEDAPDHPGIDIVELDDALGKLAGTHERLARIVELRLFGGLRVADVSALLGVSDRTVEADWRLARAWLKRELEERP